MSCNIKFRGKRLDNGEWVYGSFIANNSVIIDHDHDDLYWCVDPESVGMFTGCTDEFGKDIYEGDIISVNGKILLGWVKGGVRGYYYNVEWAKYPADENGFVLIPIMKDAKEKIELVGNIHDHSELLKGK